MEKKKLTFIISFIILCIFGILGLGLKSDNLIDINKLKTNNLVVNRQEIKKENNENLLGEELTNLVDLNKINAINTANNINKKESVSVNANESEKLSEIDKIEHSQNETKEMIESNDKINQKDSNNDNNNQNEINNGSKRDKTTINSDNGKQITKNDKIHNQTQMVDNNINATSENNKQNQTNLDNQLNSETTKIDNNGEIKADDKLDDTQTINDNNSENVINKESGEIEHLINDNNEQKNNKKNKKSKTTTNSSDTPYDNVLDKSVHHKENVLNKSYKTLESFGNEKDIMLIDEDRKNDTKSRYKLKLNIDEEQTFDADCVILNYHITTKCDSISQCMEEINSKINDLKSKLQSIDENIDIESQYYSCYPELDNGVTKQNCSYSIRINSCNVGSINEIIKICDTLNASSCYSPEYELKDEDAKKNEVLLKAIEKAKQKAKLVDSELQLVQVEEGYSYTTSENGKVRVRVNITAKFIK